MGRDDVQQTGTGCRRLGGERGTSLVLALMFLAVFGVLAIALLGFGEASVRATEGYRAQRARNLATDAALDGAINRVSHDPAIGRDPQVFGADACNPANGQVVYSQPATSTRPAVQVSCEVTAGSESGMPRELGSAPPYALLTLGDRRSTGTTATLGVRNTEPGPYNGTNFFDFLTQPNLVEYGIKFDRSRVAGIFPVGSVATWNVRGNLFSNSTIYIAQSPGAPVQVTPPTGSIGVTEARGGCVGVSGCQTVGWDFSDGKGQDPGYTPLRQPGANQVPKRADGSALPPVVMNSTWLNARIAECNSANHIVKLTPVIYTDAKVLNDLMGNSACKSATFWFQPDDNGTPADTGDDSTGTYYFDFRNNTQPAYTCGQYSPDNIFGWGGGDIARQWCVGGRAEDYGGQRVLGGTPYNWLPNANPTTHEMTLTASKAGDGEALFGLFQQTQFTNGTNCPGGTSNATLTACGSLIDGKTVDYSMTGGRVGSSIWLSHYTQVPRGTYPNIDLEIAQAGANVDRMNAPTVTVNYGSLFGGGSCGPYQLPKPPSDGTVQTFKLSAVNPVGAAQLKTCLNTGDRINSASVQYNVGRNWFGGSPYPTAKLDGIRMILTASDGSPTFPRPPSPTDVGGDCDPEAAGVQFIFGGDSRVYVPNGGMELCGGVNPEDPGNGKEIALYEPPATPRLQTTGVTATTGTVQHASYATAIAEPVVPGTSTPGPAVADISGAGATMTLRFSGYTPPAGYSIQKAELRASYDGDNSCFWFFGNQCSGTASSYELVGFPGACAGQKDVALGSELQTQTYDVTSCMTAGNRIGSNFDVRWRAGEGSVQLDGIEVVVTLAPTNPDTTLRPASGCITVSPNYAEGASDPDCALVKVDGSFTNILSTRRGRFSVKGTAYLPSGVIDIDDSDVVYPFFSRGLIARHFRLKSFKYRSGYNEPVFNNWVDTTPSERQVMFYACVQSSGACTSTASSQSGRTFVTFAAETGQPTVKNWTVQNQ
jgi:hypothetical protein